MARVVQPWLQIDWIYNLTSIGREGNKYLEQLHSFTDTVSSDLSDPIVE